MTAPSQVVVMGVSATGKTSVARSIAEALDWDFVEGDDLHPAANVAKMTAGRPLTDADREPWLDRISHLLRDRAAAGSSTVVTCSALKRDYRDRLRGEDQELFFVHLHGDFDVLEPRMTSREGHFMPQSLLESQFDTLQPLEPDEDGAVVDVSPDLDTVVRHALEEVRQRLGRQTR